MKPGGTSPGTIEYHNPTQRAQTVKAYQTDYFLLRQRRSALWRAGRVLSLRGAVDHLSPHQVTIPQRERRDPLLDPTPSDDTMNGTFWSIVMVEPIAEGSPESPGADPDKVGLGVRQVLRYGIQIVTHIGSTGERRLRFSQFQLSAERWKEGVDG